MVSRSLRDLMPTRKIASTPVASYALTRAMASAMEVIEGALVRPAMTNPESRRAATAARILPTPSSLGIRRCLRPPNGLGKSVSSIDSPATPAVSSSSTVRITFSALPYPWSASHSNGRVAARQMRCACSANSVKVRTMRSGAPSTVIEATDPANMPTSNPRDSAIRADIGSNTEAGNTHLLPESTERKRSRRSCQRDMNEPPLVAI